MVLRRLILSPRLDAVMPMAQGLPVTPVPEEFMVTTVRGDVVDVSRPDVPTFLHALHAQRVCLKVLLSGSLPGSSVPSSGSTPYFLRM